MALSPITNMPVQWQNVTVDIQPTSLYGLDHDVALISSVMLLQVPAAEDAVFVLPAEDAPVEAPVLRLVSESGENSRSEFTATPVETIEGELADALAAAQEADRKLWEIVKEQAAGGMFSTRFPVKQGDQLARFAYRKRVPAVEPGVFEFRVLAPLASYVIATGGSVSFVAGLPRVPGRAVSVLQATAENPPGTSLGDQQVQELGQRKLAGHYWQNDPLYVIRYQYA